MDGKHIKENKVRFTLGQRGCTLLEYNGFHYVRNRRSGYKTYWICAKKVRRFLFYDMILFF